MGDEGRAHPARARKPAAKANGRRHPRVPALAPRPRELPPGPEASRPVGPRRPRLARRHADRRRQEPLLPAPRARQHGPDGRRLAADRPDARPVRAPDRPRPPRGHARLRRRQPAGSRPDPPGPGDGRLRRPRALRLHGLQKRDRAKADRPVRRRRGALRVRVGPRLPPRLPAPRVDHQGARPPADDGLHRDRHAQGRRGDRRPPRPPRARAGAIRLRSPEPQLRRPALRRRRLGRAQASDAGRRPENAREPPRGRLLRHAQEHRGDRPAPHQRRAADDGVPRRHARRLPHPRPGLVHEGPGRHRRRHQRVRHGRRQGRRPLRLALGAALEPRGLLPGGRTSRPRRRTRAGRSAREPQRPRPARPLHPRGGGDRRAGRCADRATALPGRPRVRHQRGSRPDPARGRRASRRPEPGTRLLQPRPRHAHPRPDRPRQGRPAVPRGDRPPLAVLPFDRALRGDRRPLPPPPAARPLRRSHPGRADRPLLRRPRPAGLAAADHGRERQEERSHQTTARPSPTTRWRR